MLSPLDLERTFGLVGGDIFHGALSLDQIFSARPMLGHADYRAPIPGLYMCGSGTHPGGGVTGAPGHNAAREILRDVKAAQAGLNRENAPVFSSASSTVTPCEAISMRCSSCTRGSVSSNVIFPR